MDFIRSNYLVDGTEISNIIGSYGTLGGAKILSERLDENIDYTYVAGTLYAEHLHAAATDQYVLLTDYGHLFNDPVRTFMLDNYATLAQALHHERDYGFKFDSVKELASSYLFKVNGKAAESIQWLWMRVASQVAYPTEMLSYVDGSLDEVIENYEILSNRKAIYATPICINSGFRIPQLESCFVVPIGDSMESIADSHTHFLMGSKCNAGFGMDLGAIRHSQVSNRGNTKGIPGLAKHVFNEPTVYADQLGSRPAALTVHAGDHHKDARTVIRMKDRNAPLDIQATNLHYCIVQSNLFRKRILQAKCLPEDQRKEITWSFFCPREVQKFWVRVHGGNVHDTNLVSKAPSLHDLWGNEFEEFYQRCEQELAPSETIPVLDFDTEIETQRWTVGEPFIMFKDLANAKSNHQHLGTITQSNLCVRGDTLILTDKGYLSIESRVGMLTNVWNGHEWSTVTPMKTGTDQKLLQVSFSNGSIIHCTPYHKFHVIGRDGPMSAKDLQQGMEVIHWNHPNMDAVQNGAIVLGITDNGEHADTYCFNEPNRHMGIFNGVIAGNCQEIIQYTKAGEAAATCDLASINVAAFVVDGKFDWADMCRVTRVITRGLDRVIERTSGIIPNEGQRMLEKILSDPNSSHEQREFAMKLLPHVKKDLTWIGRMRNRAMGIGTMGLASCLALMDIPYESEEASEFASRIRACIYYCTLDESANMARVKGSYPTFAGSPVSKGILQQDMWAQEDKEMREFLKTLDPMVAGGFKRYSWKIPEPSTFGVDGSWDELREKCKGGMRNSLLTCQAPNGTTASVFGVSPAIEPFFSVMYSANKVAGSDKTIYDVFRTVLIREGLYDPVKIARYLKGNAGSIDGMHTQFDGELARKCRRVEKLFKNGFSINKKKYLIMCARMARFIDQSLGLTFFYAYPNVGNASDLTSLAWVNGIKNLYYARRVVGSSKVSIDLGTSRTMKNSTNANMRESVCPMSGDMHCRSCEG